jgi:hypothetical protein
LEDAGKAGHLKLSLLLDWFRSVSQDYDQLTLIFSGGKTLGEMDKAWAGSLVHVEPLRVSFLQPQEAQQLITQPVPNFPSEKIFDEGVVEEIIRVIGCHPFLIQATCSILITNLKAENRSRAEIRDIEVVTNQVLDNWWDTYFRDLWQRTDQEQLTCLKALRDLDESNIQTIAKESRLDERIVRSTLRTLLKRDLVGQKEDTYRISTPIFSEWVERNS